MRIIIDPIRYKAWLHKKIEKRVKANEELLNAFRRNDMPNGTGMGSGQEAKGTEPQKDFEVKIKTLITCKELASRLSIKSAKLVSLYTGLSEPQKEKEQEKKEVDSTVLVHVLQDIGNELGQSLAEISDSLTKLENAW